MSCVGAAPYRRWTGSSASRRYGLVLNPADRTAPIVPKAGDRLVVLAKDDG